MIYIITVWILTTSPFYLIQGQGIDSLGQNSKIKLGTILQIEGSFIWNGVFFSCVLGMLLSAAKTSFDRCMMKYTNKKK